MSHCLARQHPDDIQGQIDCQLIIKMQDWLSTLRDWAICQQSKCLSVSWRVGQKIMILRYLTPNFRQNSPKKEPTKTSKFDAVFISISKFLQKS